MKKYPFIFSENIDVYKDTDPYIVIVDKKDSGAYNLLGNLAVKLKFPDYYGFNWNAMEELMREFDWIPNKRIVIFHTDLPNLLPIEEKTYLEVLQECVEYWWHKENPSHELTVIFPPALEDKVRQIINPDVIPIRISKKK